MEGNWDAKKQGDIKEIVRRLGKLEREIEEGIDKDNVLKNKMA